MTTTDPKLSVRPEHPLLDEVQAMVAQLEKLVELLLPPDTTVPHIITYTKVQELFRLTGLSAPAMETIAQTQRISRTTADYEQIGLCEFHIGLIFLFWGQCQAAAKQFALARVQWQFVDAAPLQCLARFAEGVAFHFAFAYEAAMGCYGRSANCLPRIRFAPPSNNLDQFTAVLQTALETMQSRLQEEMSPEPEPDTVPPPPSSSHTTPPPKTADPPIVQDNVSAPPAGEERRASDYVPPPYEGNQPRRVEGGGDSPIPHHRNDGLHLQWYYVPNRVADDFLPHIKSGYWVLVDEQQPPVEPQNAKLVVIQNVRQEGSLPLLPRDKKETAVPFQRIYLAQFFPPPVQRPDSVEFKNDPVTRQVAFAPQKQIAVQETEILGTVVGFWFSTELVNMA